MSGDSSKAVHRWDWTVDGMQFGHCAGYVSHEDYAKLEQQRDALVEALTSARDYIASELARERVAFKGHENCSDIPSIEQDLARTDAALRAAGVEL